MRGEPGKSEEPTKNDNRSHARPSGAVFGPVPSRRLGMSLGVDLVPMKVCSYDCVYCELGKTTLKTIERKEYVSEEQVTRALVEYFAGGRTDGLDYVTFAGSGEPTLNTKLGGVIRKVKDLTETPIAVLTNGSLLVDPEVRDELMQADLVIPSLDAAAQNVFKKVNRPAPGMEAEDVIRGIRQFIREFRGDVWLEILFVRGVNDGRNHIEVLAEAARSIAPAKVQLTTVIRPPGIGHAPPVSSEGLHRIASMFEGDVEVVADFDRKDNRAYSEERSDAIAAMLRIRPVTLEDLSASVGLHRSEVLKYLDQLRKEHSVLEVEFLGKTYFFIER